MAGSNADTPENRETTFSELPSAAGLSVGNSTVGLMAEHALR